MTMPQLRRRMTSLDASFLYFENATSPLHIGSTCLLDGYLSRAELIEHLGRRMWRIPRYREVALFDQFNIGHPVWMADPNFDLERHVEEVQLPAGATYAEGRQVIAKLFEGLLPRDRPLWKMILVHGFPGGRTGLVSLVHHCMVDGVSGVELLTAISDFERDAPQEPARPLPPADPLPGPIQRSADAWADLMKDAIDAQLEAFRRVFDPSETTREFEAISRALAASTNQLIQPAPPTPFNRPISGQRSHVAVPMPFAEIREVRAALGGTINDVVLTTLSGALGSYLRRHGQSVDGVELRAMVPVNVRSESDKAALGNQVSMLLAPLPVGMKDPVARHKTVMAGIGKLKEANQAGGFAILSRMAERVPPMLQAAAGFFTPPTQPLFNIVCTNVPGPQIPLYIAGRMVEEIWPLVPLAAGLGLGVALASYNQVLYWGSCADPRLVPDIDAFGEDLQNAFADLLTAARAAQPVTA